MANPYVALAGVAIDVVQKFADGRSDEAFDSLNPFATANGPVAVTIPATGTVKVEHKLGAVPRNGWSLVCKLGAGDVWDYQAPDDKFLYLETDAASDLSIKLVVS